MNIIDLFSFTWFSCLWLLSFCACCLLNYLSCSETFYAQEILLYRSCFSQWSCRSNSSCRVPSDRRYEFQFLDYTLNLIGTIMIYMTWCDYKFWSLQIMYSTILVFRTHLWSWPHPWWSHWSLGGLLCSSWYDIISNNTRHSGLLIILLS